MALVRIFEIVKDQGLRRALPQLHHGGPGAINRLADDVRDEGVVDEISCFRCLILASKGVTSARGERLVDAKMGAFR